MVISIQERFEAKIIFIPEENCHTWGGRVKQRSPYGEFDLWGNKSMLAHRYAWTIYRGEIPPGAYVCHHCDNPGCVNPDHLFLGTQQDNMDDMAKKGRGGDFRGESSPRAKLNSALVVDIKKELSGGTRQKVIAQRYGVTPGTISKINTKRSWT